MDAIDFLLLPVYFILFYILGKRIAGRNNHNPFYRLYYMRGLTYKLFGSVTFACIYIFYYKGGDSINFYLIIRPLFHLFFTDPAAFFSFVFTYNAPYPWQCIGEAAQTYAFYLLKGSATLTVMRVGALLDVLCFNSYFALGLMFAFISYQFQFKVFALIGSVYPAVHKRLAIAFVMIPSVIFWGSGVGKDSIMLGAIMLFFYSFYKLVIIKQNIFKYLFLTVFTGFFITLIRSFILFTLVPCCLIMAVTYYRNSIRSSALRFFVGPLFILAGIGGSVFFLRSIGGEVESYSIESMEKKAEGFQSWHTYLGKTEHGSTYSLGENVEYTTAGIARQAPLAIVYTIFGPFIWQVHSPIMLLSVMESSILLYFTFRMLSNRKIYSLGAILFGDHIITFCIPFSIILSVAIGLTSFNFGALVRYRIPILPFFATALILINYHLTQSKSRPV